MIELTPECLVVREQDAIEMCAGKRCYIASPYTHDNQDVVCARYRRVRDFSAKMIRGGAFAFSPIAYSHQFAAVCGMGGDFSAWETFDFAMLDPMEVFVVFMDDGWNSSTGVAAESARAEALGMPVLYVIPESESDDD